jgi:two-component system, NarL family, nitrate/nitrite response regulator NarL
MVDPLIWNPIRVLLVDDHRSMLWGLDRLVSGAQPEMQVVAAVTNAPEALAAAAQHSPDVVVLDVDLGDMSGLDLLPDLSQRCRAKVLILTGMRDAHIREVAVRRGAHGIVHKLEQPETILKAIEHIHRGELWVDRATMAKVITAVSGGNGTEQSGAENSQSHTLTRKECEIIAAVVAHLGAPIKVIAQSLCLSNHTVSNHLASIYSKLGVHNRLELFMYAKEHGLDRPPGPTTSHGSEATGATMNKVP